MKTQLNEELDQALLDYKKLDSEFDQARSEISDLHK